MELGGREMGKENVPKQLQSQKFEDIHLNLEEELYRTCLLMPLLSLSFCIPVQIIIDFFPIVKDKRTTRRCMVYHISCLFLKFSFEQ